MYNYIDILYPPLNDDAKKKIKEVCADFIFDVEFEKALERADNIDFDDDFLNTNDDE